jgi:hypothetical protein
MDSNPISIGHFLHAERGATGIVRLRDVMVNIVQL